MMRRQLPLLSVLATVAVLSAGCSSSSDSSSDDAAKAGTGPRYVALGDSYTAGPEIAQGDGSSGTCDRSLRNYPRLVAKKIEAASFTDVSCSGATTDNITKAVPIQGQGATIPAQLDAVTADTTLVTIGIGGNDDDLFSTLATSCTKEGTACADYLKNTLPTVLRATRTRVAASIDAVQAKAPKAEVILVGYLGVVPPTSGCEALGGDALDTRAVSAGERSIDTMMKTAADAAGATYVSMNAASKGHDACAAGDAAWTNGIAPRKLGDGASLHPRPGGMAAVATAVEDAIATAS